MGDFKAPEALSGLWSYTDHQTGVVYRYRIPRYYDKYLSQDALLFRKISTAWTYANIISMVKKNDHIKASDPLVVFESSFDEADINELLDKLGSDLGHDVLESGHNSITSKTSGDIIDIKIYYNRPIEEFSPSLRKLINDYKGENERRSKVVRNAKSDDIVQVAATEQIEYPKIFGKEFDGLLIQFFIRHVDNFYSGNKISFQVALKSINSTIIDEKDAPYSDFDQEKIDLAVSPMSYISRMTNDFYMNLYCNKTIIGLKKACKKIWTSIVTGKQIGRAHV